MPNGHESFCYGDKIHGDKNEPNGKPSCDDNLVKMEETHQEGRERPNGTAWTRSPAGYQCALMSRRSG